MAEWGEILQNYYQNLPIIIKSPIYDFWAREEIKYMDSLWRAYFVVSDKIRGSISYNYDNSEIPRAICVSP